MNLYKYIYPYIFRHKGMFLTYFIFSLLVWGLSLYNPYLIGIFVDSLKDISIGANENEASKILLILFFSWGIQVISSFFNGIISSRFFIKAEFDVKNHVFMHLKQLPLSYLGKNSASYFTQLINNDSKAITDFVVQSTLSLITTFLSLIYILIFMSKLSMQMTILIILLIPVYFISYNIFKGSLYETNLVFKENQNEFFSKMNHQLSHIKYIKIHGIFEESNSEVIDKFNPVFSSEMKYVHMKQRYVAIGNLSRFLINIVIFSYSAKEILKGNMSLGTFTMINTYSAILISNVSYALSYGSSYQSALVAYNRLQSILSSEIEADGDALIHIVDNIVIDNLSFSYDGTKEVLCKINNTFEKGKIYVFTGPNGAGKSTLYSLLIGLIRGFDGSISINGINITDINMTNFRKNKCAVVLQEPDLYFDSIKENLNIVDHDLFSQLAEKLNFCKFVNGLENEIDFSLSKNSSNVSGGEKQKIAVLGALSKNAEVVILDEPTSALDQNSIKNLYNILKKEKQDKIIIIITHNLDIVEIADEVIDIF